MEEIQFNLDMLNVQTGMRSVTAKAKSPGYDDSYESNTVMFADTMKLSGTWRFKDTLNPPTNDTWRIIEHIPFTSYLNSSGVHTKFNSMQFSKNVYIQATGKVVWCLWYSSTGEETGTAVSSQMYVETKGWASGSSPECKTVTFDGVVVVSKEFYEWFTANAEQLQISAPVISCYGSGLSINYSSPTEKISILVNGIEKTTVEVPKNYNYASFNLSTLNLSVGTYSIAVKAKANGYTDSEPSNTVSYTVVQVSGTWVFDAELISTWIEVGTEYFNFTSNGKLFNCFNPIDGGDGLQYCWGDGMYDRIDVWHDYDGWYDEAYRTITFEGVQTVSKEFYDWLVANAIQTHKLLPIGTYVWDEDIYNDSYYYFDVEFVSNGETFIRLDSDMGDANRLTYWDSDNTFKTVYTASGGWVNDAYRTMVFKTNAMIPISEYDDFMSDVTYKKTPNQSNEVNQ